MINLDYKDRTPIYEQIVREIERFVALGIYEEGMKMPSIRQLAIELGINPNTVKKAYTILENKGVIKTISTKGTFVGNNTMLVVNEKIDKEIDEIKNKIEDLEKLGITRKEILDRLR